MFGNYYQVSFFRAVFNFREIRGVALEDLCQYQSFRLHSIFYIIKILH